MKNDNLFTNVVTTLLLLATILWAQPSIISMSPTNNHKPDFQWSSVSGASNYKIEIANNGTFSPTLLSQNTSSATNYTPTTDLPAGKIFWHVSDDYNGQTNYSTADTFYISDAPILTSISPDSISTLRPSFAWTTLSGASTYNLQISKSSSFSTLELDTNIISMLTCTPMNNLPEGRFYVRIGSDANSYWSPTDSIMIALPNPTRFDGSVTRNSMPTFNWDAYPGANVYNFEISTETSFATTIESQNVSGATTYTLSTALYTPSMLYWHVNVNAFDYSIIDSIRFSKSPEPIFFGVNDTFTNVSPTFKWKKATAATGYIIEVDSSKNFNSTYNFTDTTFANADTSTTTSHSLAPGKNYWRVKMDTSYNDYSEIDSFYVIDTIRPHLIRFEGSIIEQRKPKLVWNALAGATEYVIYADTIKGGSGLMYENSYSIDDTTKVPYSSFPLNKKIYWQVQSNVNYQWSNVDSFTIIDTTTSYYLSSIATDSTGNGSISSPFKYFYQVEGVLSIGDTLKIASGTYTPDTTIAISEDSITILGGYDIAFTIRNSDSLPAIINGSNFTDTSSWAYMLPTHNYWAIDGLKFVNITQQAVKGMHSNMGLTVKNCKFINCNKAIYLESVSDVIIKNNIFAYGAIGVYAEDNYGSNMELANNTFFKNSEAAFQVYGYGVYAKNNIFANNGKAYLNTSESMGFDSLRYNNFYFNDTLYISRSYNDTTVFFQIDSLKDTPNKSFTFSTPLNPDFEDTSIAIQNLHLSSVSSCQDAGDPTDDYSLEPSPNGGRINLGAYGGTIWASVQGEKPIINSNPISDTLEENTQLLLSVSISTGTTPIQYKWQKDGVDITGATSDTLKIDSIKLADSGLYRVIAYNSFGNDTSTNATILVVDATPPNSVTLDSLTEENSSSFHVNWTNSTSSDVKEVLVVVSLDSLIKTPTTTTYSKTISMPGTAAFIQSLPSNGVTAYVSLFAQDTAGNWSAFSYNASDTITLTNNTIPYNYVDASLSALGDTAVTISLNIVGTAGTENGILLNISKDSSEVRYISQDTLLLKDTVITKKLFDDGLYYISWATFDNTGLKSEIKSHTFTLKNTAPILSLPPLDSVYAESLWVLEKYVEDYNNDAIIVTLQNAPSGMSIESGSNKISWSPNMTQSGLHKIYVTATDESNLFVSDTLELFVIYINKPPVITINSKKLSGSALKYAISATDDSDTSFTYYGKVTEAGGTVFYSDSNSSGSFLIYPIPDGTYYSSCSVTDSEGATTTVIDTVNIADVTERKFSISSSWNMVSVPASKYSSDTTLDNIIIQHWSEENEQNGVYKYYKKIEGSNNLQLRKSYWIKNNSKTASDMAVYLDKSSLQKTDTIISLTKDEYGWNQISSPYTYPIKWDSDLTLWEWNETTKEYIDAENILYPWRGYWVLAETTEDIHLNSEPLFDTKRRGKKDSRFENSSNWSYNLKLISELGNDNDNRFGINNRASSGRDRSDRAEPPRVDDRPYIFFAHSDWNGPIKEFASDIRSSSTNTILYNVGISGTTTPVKNLKIKVEGRRRSDPIYLFVRTKNGFSELGTDDKIDITASEKTEYITIFASRNKNLLSTLPLKFKAIQPYPNPCRGIANIQYALPYRWNTDGLLLNSSYNVSIKMYDIRGRMVKNLLNKKQSVGNYHITWDGTGQGGSSIASGAYLIRISADNNSAVKKMIMFK